MLIPVDNTVYIFLAIAIIVFMITAVLYSVNNLRGLKLIVNLSALRFFGGLMIANAIFSSFVAYVIMIFTIGTLSTYHEIIDKGVDKEYYILFSFKNPNGEVVNTWWEHKFIYNKSKYYLKIKHISYGSIGQDGHIAKTIYPNEFYAVPDSIEDLMFGNIPESINESRLFPKRHYALIEEYWP